MTKERRPECLPNTPTSNANNILSVLGKNFQLGPSPVAHWDVTSSLSIGGAHCRERFPQAWGGPPMWWLLSEEEFNNHLCGFNFCGSSSTKRTQSKGMKRKASAVSWGSVGGRKLKGLFSYITLKSSRTWMLMLNTKTKVNVIICGASFDFTTPSSMARYAVTSLILFQFLWDRLLLCRSNWSQTHNLYFYPGLHSAWIIGTHHHTWCVCVCVFVYISKHFCLSIMTF